MTKTSSFPKGMGKKVQVIRYAAILMTELDASAIPECAIRCVAESLGVEKSLDEILAIVNTPRRVKFTNVETPPTQEEIDKLASTRSLRKAVASLYSADELSLIGRLMNPSVKWSSTKLVAAFSHLVSFDNAARVLKASPTSKVRQYSFPTQNDSPDFALEVIAKASKGCLGNKSDECPDSYDAAMLFTACVVLGVATKTKDTITTLARKVACAELLTLDAIPQLVKSHVERTIDKCNECKFSSTERRARVKSAVAGIATAARSIASVIHSRSPGALRAISPESDGEACAIAACAFEVDIADSDCPIAEYGRLLVSKCRSEAYVPISIGSRFYSCVTFFPRVISVFEGLWSSVYAPLFTQSRVDAVALSERFSIVKPPGFVVAVVSGAESPASGISQTQSAYATTNDALRAMETRNGTVLCGWHPRATNTVTPFSQEELFTIARKGEGILTFGTPLESLVAISVSDVVASFLSTKAFVVVDSRGKTLFLSQRIVDKLKHIATSEAGKEFAELAEAIDTVSKSAVCLSLHSKALADAIAKTNSPSDTLDACVSVMTRLVEVGMYMRGWKISKSEFPLVSIDTTYPAEKQVDVEVNVALAIAAFDEEVEKIDPGVKQLLKTAPLLFARPSAVPGGKKTLVPPINSEQQGSTIEERLAIVKAGEASGNIFACMRTSSNYILASAFGVLNALGAAPPFDIEQLDDIQ